MSEPKLPGRLGTPEMQLKDDPRADPRMLAAMAPLAMGEHPPPAGVDKNSSVDELLEYLNVAEEGFGSLFDALGNKLEPIPGVAKRTEVIKGVDPSLPVARIQSMEGVVGSSMNWRTTPMRLLSGFALIGLLLASIGVYGVLAYYVSQRTREIGVRAALGASRPQLAGMVIRQSMLPIVAGVVLGVAGSLASGRLLQELLYQVRPGDPQVIGAIVGLLIAVGLFASWIPARRAASIDPMVALRDE